MKTPFVLFLSIAMALCLFSSCTKDNDEYPSNTIVGKWICTEIVTDVKTNNSLATNRIIEDIGLVTNGNHSLEFANDGKCVYYHSEFEGSFNATYTLDGYNLNLAFEDFHILYTISNDNKVIIQIDDWKNYFHTSDFEDWGIVNPQSVVVEKALCYYYYTRQK